MSLVARFGAHFPLHALLQGMSRSGSGIGMHEARGLEHRLGSRGSGVCFVDMRQVQGGGGGGRNRSAALAGIERLNSGGSEQRLYRGQRSDGAWDFGVPLLAAFH